MPNSSQFYHVRFGSTILPEKQILEGFEVELSLRSDSQEEEMKEVKGVEKKKESGLEDKPLKIACKLETSLFAFYGL